MTDKLQTTQSLQQRIASLSPAQQQLFRKQLEAKGIPWDQAVARSEEPIEPVTATAIARPAKLPLSASQKHLWVLHQLYPDTSAYHISMVLDMKGTLSSAAMQQSLQSIVNRHESLRTVFLQEDNQPYTKVLPAVELEFPVIDLTESVDAMAEATRYCQQLAQTPFNLECGPLLRSQLIKTEDNCFQLVLVLHHLIADGWSRGVLFQELATNYRHHIQGKAAQPLPELTAQYPDYVLQQQQWLKGEACQRQKAYWKQQLAELPELTLLTDGIGGTDFVSKTCTQTFSVEQTQAIKSLAKKSGATLFMLLLAIFKLLLHRYSHQRDIAVGVPVAGRKSSAVEPLIGFFVNTLVLKSQIDPQQQFSDWLKQVQSTLADAFQNQDVPFSEVVDAVGALRAPGKNPLFRVMFQVQSDGYRLQNSESLNLDMPGLQLSQQWIKTEETKFDMSWHVIERDSRLLVAVEYRSALFAPARIERMLSHFQTLTESVVANPVQPIAQFSSLSSVEKEQILSNWSQGKTVAPSTRCFPARFEEQVQKTPSVVAITDNARKSQTTCYQLTYQQLNQRANKLAHWLRSQGVGPGVLVGVCVHPGIDLVAALLATLKAGGAYIPLDPSLPAERVQYMIRDTNPTALICHRDCLDLKLAHEYSTKVFCVDQDEPQLIAQSGDNLAATATPKDLAYVIYTSGSTGRPKGTQLTHGGLINYLNWCLEAYPVGAGCGAPVQSSVGFDATITSLFSPLLAGKQVVFGLGETEIEALQSALSGGFSFIKLTPAHLSALQPLLATQVIERDRLPKAFIIGGEALQAHHISTWRAQYPEVKLFNEYGPTEAVVGCCAHQVSEKDNGNIPIGRPITGAQLYVLDEGQQPAATGVPGELYIGGAGVARGYLNQPELTAERFVVDTFSGGETLYKTGDLVTYRSDGTLEYLGRIDSQIKLRGFRIEPGEIENVLCQHELVDRAVVVLKAKGTQRELIAYVIATADRLHLEEELHQQLAQALPSYMVPSYIVVLEALPLTVNGKIDREALPAPVAIANEEKSEPRNHKESVLLSIWKQILDRTDVGIHDNFFDLGGDSISGMQIVSKAYEEGLQLTPTQLFEHQTIAEQAAVAKEKLSSSLSSTPAIGLVTLSPIQADFFEQNLPNPAHYNQAVMLTVEPNAQGSVLESSLVSLVQHHDSLRLRFQKIKGRWQQQYAPIDTVTVPFDKVDLRQQNDFAVDEAIARLQASLNLENGPLLRGALLTLDSGKYLLLIAHHLVVDGVSWRILLNDLCIAYQQISTGQPVSLPAKTTAFSHWTQHLRDKLPAFKTERGYWIETSRPTNALPIDRPTGSNTVGDSREMVVGFDEQTTASLKTLRPSVNVVLLLALAQTLKQWSQNDTVVLDIEGHGRHVWDESLNLARTVGWFTSLYPLRLSLPSGSLDEQLEQVAGQLERVPNGGSGYGALRFSESGSADMISPAEISFNYLGQLAVETTGFITGLASKPVPATKDLRGDRKYLFEIVALIQSDQLQIRWRYSKQQYQQST
ncbi:MAG: amino acid adenylation domain-containing protein, partial [Cyanobacteria bacterium P01_D01_bin.36]